MSRPRPSELSVEEIRKLALPLSTHIVAGEGLLDQAITWTTVIYPEDDIASKSVQRRELILIAPVSNPPRAHSDTELLQWAAKVEAAAVVHSGPVSATALAEAKSCKLPVMTMAEGHAHTRSRKDDHQPAGQSQESDRPARHADLSPAYADFLAQ